MNSRAVRIVSGMPTREWLTPSEVAAMFDVHPRTVTRWVNEGRLTARLTLGGHRRISRAAVEALLRAQGERQEP